MRLKLSRAAFVLDEAAMARHLVVQQPGGRVAVVGQPIDLGRAGLVGRVIDRVDQLARDAGAPAARIDEQVVEIAGGVHQPGRAVEQVVREADEPAVALGDQAIDRFLLVEETIPGGARRVLGNARAIELLIALPQGQPSFEIRVAHGADDRIVALHPPTLARMRALRIRSIFRRSGCRFGVENAPRRWLWSGRPDSRDSSLIRSQGLAFGSSDWRNSLIGPPLRSRWLSERSTARRNS